MQLTAHAQERLVARGIDPAVVARAISAPDMQEQLAGDRLRIAFRTKGHDVLMVVLVAQDDGNVSIATMFSVSDPTRVLALNLERARKLLRHDPGAAAVFAVAAFEAYCVDVFGALGDFEQYLVTSRRISFQQLDTAKELFRRRMNVDLAEDGAAWNSVQQLFAWRHLLVHRAGVDANGNVLRLAADEVEARIDGVRKVLTALSADGGVQPAP